MPTNTVAGSAGADTLTGAEGSDLLSGLAGSDSLVGAEGDDSLSGGAGNDTLAGGAGADAAIYTGVQAGYRVQAGADGRLTVTDTDPTNGDEGTDVLESVERLAFADATLAVSVVPGPDLLVNTTTSSNQYNPSSARLSNGGYVTVWQSPDASDYGICGQRFDAQGGKLGGEFRVNTSTSGSQSFSDDEAALKAVAGTADGGFIVTWRSSESDGNSWGVVAQRFNAQAAPLGPEIRVNTTTVGEQRDPSVAVLADGKFVIVWMDVNQEDSGPGKDTNGWGIYGQLFDAQGAKVGSEFLVNSNVQGEQYWPSATALSGGGFVVNWRDSNGTDAVAQLFDANGAKLGVSFSLNTWESGGGNWQWAGSTSALADGGFWAVWQSEHQDGSWRGVYMQRFAADGTKVGAEMLVNTTTANSQQLPQIDTRADGSFVVVWSSNAQDGSGSGIYAQTFDPSGNRSGAELQVNLATEGDQYNPDVVALTDGRFVVTWEAYNGQDGSGHGVFSRMYDPVSGFNSLSVTAGALNDLVVQPLALLIDGGPGADTLQGGTLNNVYLVDNTGDVVIEAPNGGSDEVRSSVSYTLPDHLESLTLTGALPISATGNPLANQLTGNSAANSLSGGGGHDALWAGGGNDTLAGGPGYDTLDGGAGINVAVFQGTADFYSRRVNSSGQWIIRDTLTDGSDPLDGSDEGADTLTNIQILRFVRPDGVLDSEVRIDDHANLADPSNVAIAYGERVFGLINFYTDTDHFNVQAVAGQRLWLSGASSNGGAAIYGGGVARGLNALGEISFNASGLLPVFIGGDNGTPGPGSTQSAASYQFILRRMGPDGTSSPDLLQAGTSFEYLSGNEGNDTLLGSARSDLLLGGAGNDLLTGGGGDDEIDGGAGGSNTAVFSAPRSAYAIQWRADNGYYLRVEHLNNDADGIDQLRNVQVLRFADGDLTLDRESNSPEGAATVALGQPVLGSLLGVPARGWWDLDVDYFRQRLTGVSATTVLRIKFEYDAPDVREWQLRASFTSVDTQEPLRFQDAGSGATITEFNSWEGRNTFFVKPIQWGAGTPFTGEPADLRISGWAWSDTSAPLSYRIVVDRVQLGTAAAELITGDGKASYIDAQAGSDTVIGSALAEEIVGGAGDDSIVGSEGNDTLIGGIDRDTLIGGAGDDVIDVSGSSTGAGLPVLAPQGVVSGGDGVDTLRVGSGADLAGLSISGVEVLDVMGGKTQLTPQQVLALGFTTAQRATFRLDPNLADGGTLDASVLSGRFDLRGTNQTDVLTGNDAANTIHLGAEEAGGGGLGRDTVVAGGGDDTILLNTMRSITRPMAQQFFSSVDFATRTYGLAGRLDGGAGNDAFVIDFTNPWWTHAWGGDAVYYSGATTPTWHLDLSDLSMPGIERFEIKGYDPTIPWWVPTDIIMRPQQLESLSTAAGLRQVRFVGGGTVDLAKLQSLGVVSWRLGDSSAYTVTGTGVADTLALASGVANVSLGAGDDQISINGQATPTHTIDGGAGSDTLTITGADVDLSDVRITGVENIVASSTSLALTRAQFDQFQGAIAGSAGLILKMTAPGLATMTGLPTSFVGVRGTQGADSITGSANPDLLISAAGNDLISGGAGRDTLQGGEGDDTLIGGAGNDTLDGGAGVNTVRYAGNFADYRVQVDRSSPGALSVTDVNLANGDEGTDVLLNTQVREFADGVYQIEVMSSPLERQVNSYTASDQLYPSIARLKDGGFVVSWQSYRQDGSEWGVYAQRFDSLGDKVGVEFLVPTNTSGNQLTAQHEGDSNRQTAAALVDGGFVLTWSSEGDGSAYGVYGRRFDALGQSVGSEFRINTTTANQQFNPSVAGLTGGGFVVTWTSDHQGPWRVFGQRFDANANPIGSEFKVEQSAGGGQRYAVLAGLTSGGYVVAWADEQVDGSGFGIRAQVFDAMGARAGSQFQVNTFGSNTQMQPSIAALPSGGFVVVWSSEGQDGSSWGIYGQRFDAQGAKAGQEFLINTYTNDQQRWPQVGAFADGGFVVTWSSLGQDGSTWGMFGQRFAADGSKVGPEQALSSYTYGEQVQSAVATLADGSYAAVWHSQNQDGDGWSVQSNVFDVAALKITGNDGANVITQPNARWIDGGAGADTMQGGTSDTVYIVDNAGDVVVETANGGRDEVRSSVSYTLPDHAEVLTLTGTASLSGTGNALANVLTGNAAANSLSGGAGNDTLQGGEGDDTLIGGAGNDTLDGGSGTNTARFAGNFADYRVQVDRSIPGALSITDVNLTNGDEGTDVLINTQVREFADGVYRIEVMEQVQDRVLNTYALSSQQDPTMVRLAGGGYAVAWQSESQDGSGWGVYAQRFSDLGVALGSELRVNEGTSGNQLIRGVEGDSSRQSIGALSGGGFVVTWTGDGDGSGYGVWARLFDADGQPMGGDFRLNTATQGHQFNSSVTGLKSGGFITTWTSEQSGLKEVYARAYDSAGQPLAAEFRVKSGAGGSQWAAVVTELKSGGYVIAWVDDQTDGSSWGIRAQVFTASGLLAGDAFTVNSQASHHQYHPSMAALPDGGFMAVWASPYQDGAGWGVYAQRFNAAGAKVGSEWRVNTSTGGDQYWPQVSVFDDGGFLVAWADQSLDGSDWGIYAQRYDAAGAAVGSEARINTTTQGAQFVPALAALGSGAYAVAWNAFAQDGSSNAIAGRVMNVIALKITGNDGANVITQPNARWIDGGTGADTMQGGTTDTTYIVDNTGDVVVETANGGRDEVRSSVAYTLPNHVEALTLTGAQAVAGTGNSLDNTITIQSAAQPTGAIDGGAGLDTLVLSMVQDLSGVSLTSIEAISGSGAGSILVAAAQLAGVQKIAGVQLQLTGAPGSAPGVDFGALSISEGSSLRVPGFDAELAGQSGVLGSDRDDSITGGASADRLFGGRGADTLVGGAGNDTLAGGRGLDRIEAGAGDDLVQMNTSEATAPGTLVYVWGTNRLLTLDQIDGGEGRDVLRIADDASDYVTIRVDASRLSGVEEVDLSGGSNNILDVDAQTWSRVARWNFASTWDSGVAIRGNGEDIDLNRLDATGAYLSSNIALLGSYRNVTADLLTASTRNGYNSVWVQSFDRVDFSPAGDRLSTPDSSFTLNFGAGDDVLNWEGAGRLTATIDGGAGVDTITLGTGDLSGATLTGIERVNFSGSLVVNAAQKAALTIEGTGSIWVRSGNVLQGTAAADTYSGDGTEIVIAGGGNDTISNVQVVQFSGRIEDYQYSRPNNDGTVVVQHKQGSMADGLDTLVNVQKIQFAGGGEVVLDDLPNFLNVNSGRADYDKRVSGRKDYNNDTDVFKARLEPSSPLNIEASTQRGNGWQAVFYSQEPDSFGQQLEFKSLKYGWRQGAFYSWMNADQQVVPGFFTANGFVAYKGGEVRIDWLVYGDQAEDYAFTLKLLDDFAGSAATVGSIDPDVGQVQGYIGGEGDRDWVRTELQAGTLYVFDIVGSGGGGGTLGDPRLRILDAQGRELAQVDGYDLPPGVGGDVQHRFRAPATGTYYLEVSDSSGLYKGSYTVKQQSLDEVAGDVTTLGRLEWEGPQARTGGEINAIGDRDWYRIRLEKGQTYQIDAVGRATGEGSLANPAVEVRSSTGTLLDFSDDGGIGTNASLAFLAREAGWYYVGVSGSGNSSKGTYQVRVSTLQDDYDDSTASQAVLQVGTTLRGVIQTPGDADWVRVGLTAGATYVMTLEGDFSAEARLDPLSDPRLQVRDSAGQVLATADDTLAGRDARLYFTPTQSGVYFLEAASAFRYDVGSYALKVALAPADDFADDLRARAAPGESVGVLTLGSQGRAGEIQTPGDTDWFAVTLQGGTTYRLEVKGFGGFGGTMADPYLRVFDSQGRLVEAADDGGAGTDAALYFAPTTTGTFYLEASSALSSGLNSGLGTYTVRALATNLPPDDVGNDALSARPLTVGNSFQGQLLTHGDQDWFKLSLNAGQRYVFMLRGAGTGDGTLADPYLELRDANGALVVSNDNGSWLGNAGFSFLAPGSGSYYLVARAASAQMTGSYTLISRQPDDHPDVALGGTPISLGGAAITGAIQWADGTFGAAARDALGTAIDIDEDWLSVSLQAGQVVSVMVRPQGALALPRAMVEVFDPFKVGVAIADGKDTSDGTAVATFRASQSGTYSIRVREGSGATGDYSVQVKAGDAADEDGSGPVQLAFQASGSAGTAVAAATARVGIAGDSDQFRVAVQDGHDYRIEILPNRSGVHAPLEDSALSIQWQSGAGNPNQPVDLGQGRELQRGATTAFSARAAGTLTLTVSATDPLATGQYRVQVIDLGLTGQDDRPDSIARYSETTHGVLTLGTSARGEINSVRDVDLFAVSLMANQAYAFAVKGFGAGEGSLAQAQFQLLDASGRLVGAGVNDTETGSAQMALTVFTAGRYYLAISPVDVEGNRGSYLLETQTVVDAPAADDVPDSAATGVTVAPGVPLVSSIQHAGDADWAKVMLVAGRTYTVDVLGGGAGVGFLPDSTLRLLAADGTLVATDDDSGAGRDARLRFTATSSGVHYLVVQGGGDATGTYTLRVRELYSGTEDPLAASQWVLGTMGLPLLGGEYSGASITVGLIDDGIDYSHPDLANQVDLANDYDAEFKTSTGIIKYPPLISLLGPDDHGTQVAGIIAAERGNETGIVGIAYDAQIASTRVKWGASQITDALSRQGAFDISNNSWGYTSPFADDFQSTALTMSYVNLRQAVQNGRDGLGTVFVFAAGNARSEGDNTNHHNFQNAREVITVAAANADGSVAGFSTPGASILVAAPGVGVLTTVRLSNPLLPDYAPMVGTSAATPVVSAVVALMLEANPGLGYRDVQHILALSARHDAASTSWKTNAAGHLNMGGLRFNDDLGFGLVDAHAAVRLAETWTGTRTALNEVYAGDRVLGLNDAIPDASAAGRSYTFSIDDHLQVEHVELAVDIRHSRLGDLIVELVSPSGTVSTLLNRPTVTDERPFGLVGEFSGLPTRLMFTLQSVQFMGEDARGAWTVRVRDARAEETGTVRGLSLKVFGAADSEDDFYVFTDEFISPPPSEQLRDDGGRDVLNFAAVTKPVIVNLAHHYAEFSNGAKLRIAPYSELEAVYTGDGADMIVGDDIANVINAGRGNDTLAGGKGNDTLVGGPGKDTAVFGGKATDYVITYDALRGAVTVRDVRPSGGPDGTDELFGIESITFVDSVMSLAGQLGNRAPTVSKAIASQPLRIPEGTDLEFTVATDAFADVDEGGQGLALSAELTGGMELPEWLSFDPVTRKLKGQPPEGTSGRFYVKVKAEDDFGEQVEQELVIEIGDNRAPFIDRDKALAFTEDHPGLALDINRPVDPEGDQIEIRVVELPTSGAVMLASGESLVTGQVITLTQLEDLVYRPAQDFFGEAGRFLYQAVDARGVMSQQVISLSVSPVNDAPRFGPDTVLNINYTGAAVDAALDVSVPTDLESTLAQVLVTELPTYGRVYVRSSGATVAVGDRITLAQLRELSFAFQTQTNGPIGALGLRVTDAEGASASWRLAINIQGQASAVDGDAGDNAVYGSLLADTLKGFGGQDTLVGNAGDDRLYGGSGNDMVLGGSGADLIDGGSGHDFLDGGPGADTMYGGPGNDVYVVEHASDLVMEVLDRGAGGDDTVRTSLPAYTAPTNVEAVELTAAVAGALTGNSGDNRLAGNSLADQLWGLAGNDTLWGFDGNDTLDGGLGRDNMIGGTGDDTYIVDSRSDLITEASASGYDIVLANASFVLPANVEKLVLTGSDHLSGGGNSLANWIVGNGGNNTLAGGLGADTMEGGSGDDVYVVNELGDVIVDSGGNDTIRASVSWKLGYGLERLELMGLNNLEAYGNSEANHLVGNSGDNLLDGLGGLDTLTGSSGSDSFVISNPNGGTSVVRITDFKSKEDLIILNISDFGLDQSVLGGLSSLVPVRNYVVGPGAVALDQDDYLIFDVSTGRLYLDLDGNGVSSPRLIGIIEGDAPLPTDIFWGP